MEIRETGVFAQWFAKLKDQQAKARILVRIRRLSLGNAGDSVHLGEGVSELRVHYGPGYRVYFTERGGTIVILLCGGGKSTQIEDIRVAKSLARSMET